MPFSTRFLSAVLVFAAFAILLTGCGGGTSGNVDVVLVDRSKSFCELNLNCKNKIAAVVGDRLADLSKHGGSLRLLLIGNDTGAPVEASENEHCTGILRGAAACFPKPSFWGSIFGRSGTQKRAALAKIKTDVAAGLAKGRTLVGTSIFDAIMAAQPFLADRRLPPGLDQLVILSDMIEDSKSGPSLTCATVGTPAQNQKVLEALRKQGRLPDLHYVTVEVLGANAKNHLNEPCRESFWRAYFSRTGAELTVIQQL
jgi:hypothetical protein